MYWSVRSDMVQKYIWPKLMVWSRKRSSVPRFWPWSVPQCSSCWEVLSCWRHQPISRLITKSSDKDSSTIQVPQQIQAARRDSSDIHSCQSCIYSQNFVILVPRWTVYMLHDRLVCSIQDDHIQKGLLAEPIWHTQEQWNWHTAWK